MTTTEYESKRPPAHWLTETVCDMLAFDGKPYTLTIEQQVSWDDRMGKLARVHGEDKTLDLLREFYDTGRLKKSTRPGDFANFVAMATGGGSHAQYTPGDQWSAAVNRCRQNAQRASGMPEPVVYRLMSECRNDLMAAAMPEGADDGMRERVRPQAKLRCEEAMRQAWGELGAWKRWKQETTAEFSGGRQWSRLSIGGAA